MTRANDMRPSAPLCDVCDQRMLLRRIYPRTWVLPEVRAFECQLCGNACSIEFEVTAKRGESGRANAGAVSPIVH